MPTGFKRRVVIAGLFAVVLAVLPMAAFGNIEGQESRIWTDIEGREIHAVLVAFEGDSVQIEKDGKVYTVPTARLSTADLTYLQAVTESRGTPFLRDSPARDSASALLAACLDHSRISAVQTIPPIDLLNKTTGKLDATRLARVMELLPEPEAVRTRWGPDYVKEVRACAAQLRETVPGVKYLGFTFTDGMELDDPETRYGAPDHVIPAEYEPELDGFGLPDMYLAWHLWGWIALGMDEDGTVRALRVDCKALVGVP